MRFKSFPGYKNLVRQTISLSFIFHVKSIITHNDDDTVDNFVSDYLDSSMKKL